MNAPSHLSHKPIIAVNDYDKIDAIYAVDTDVRALSIGQAQYDIDELSVKIWRHTAERWSRQSEEMPIHRALDLSILIVASILTDTVAKYPLTSLREEIMIEDRVPEIWQYYEEHKRMLRPRLEELRRVLDTFFSKEKL
jgi:hypothetical protein